MTAVGGGGPAVDGSGPGGDRTLANAALPRHHQNVMHEDRQRESQFRVRFIARGSTQAVSVNYNF